MPPWKETDLVARVVGERPDVSERTVIAASHVLLAVQPVAIAVQAPGGGGAETNALGELATLVAKKGDLHSPALQTFFRLFLPKGNLALNLASILPRPCWPPQLAECADAFTGR